MKRKFGGRGLKSLREVYEETRSRVWCYMFVSDDMWIKEALKQETRKECNSVKKQREKVQHLLARCKMLVSSEYLAIYNRALIMMAVARAKEQNLLDQNVKWYQEK